MRLETKIDIMSSAVHSDTKFADDMIGHKRSNLYFRCMYSSLTTESSWKPASKPERFK